MSDPTAFGQAERAAVTVLVDNHADMIVRSSDTINYFDDEPLLAEHGLSMLIDLNDGEVRILWDAGISSGALLENSRRMGIDLKTIDAIAISHGHGDHTAAVGELLRAIDLLPQPKKWDPDTPMEEMVAWARGRRLPLVVHPAAFRERWAVGKSGRRYGPIQPPPRAEWEALGAEVILSEGPYRLGPGCWTTGAVPRRSFERAGIPERLTYRGDGQFSPDYLEEDQAIVLHIREKGLVVLSGCAHSGIVNTVRYAQEISGVERVHAVLGGFHLARAEAEETERTVEAIAEIGPALLVPSHCTGPAAIRRFAARMPDAYVDGVVGATYLF